MNTSIRHKRKRLEPALLARMAERLRVLAHADRLRVVEILERRTEAPVLEIAGELGLPQANVSTHLTKMRRAGLIACTRRGKQVWYRIADPNALTILACIRKKGTNR